MHTLFEQCPACGGQIVVTECKCANCQLQMRGEFQPGHFFALSDDQLNFIKVFVRARGNLSEVEKILGVSYPTIRNKLDEINHALDRAESSESESKTGSKDETRRKILEQVAIGKISTEDAIQKLSKKKEV